MAGRVVLDVLRHIWITLSALPYPIALMGGLALSVWQRIRLTQDVDILIGVDEANVHSVIDALQHAGFRPKLKQPVLDLGSVRIVQMLYQPPSVFMDVQVDLLLAESDYHKQALARRVSVTLEGLAEEVFALSCEDLIIHKLIAGRIIDRADAAELLRINRSTLDLAYVLGCVQKLDLTAAMAEIWREACPGEELPITS